MKTILRKTFLATILAMFAVVANAHDFYKDGIYYNITSSSDKTVEVTFKDDRYYYVDDEYGDYVTIPESVVYNGVTYSVTGIHNYTFYDCENVRSITIPSSVTEIGDQVFYNCTSLTSLTIADGTNNLNFKSNEVIKYTPLETLYLGRDLTYSGFSPFHGITTLTSLTIGNSVTTISDYAFYNCTGLKSVTIPSSVTTIGDYAFQDCSSLTSLTIGDNVATIGDYAFQDCSSLTSLDIPDSVTSIGSSAFQSCTGLTSVDIPNSVETIGNSAFFGCTGLMSVTVGSGVTSIGTSAFPSSVVKMIWKSSTPPSGYENVESAINYVPNDSYTSLSSTKVYSYLDYIFEVGGIKYVPVNMSKRTCDAIDCSYTSDAANTILPNTVTNASITFTVNAIQPYVCYNNDSITSLQLDFAGDVPEYAFYDCNNLTDATLGEGITSIGSYTFANCSSLNGAALPNTVTTLGSYAFSGCSAMASATIGTGLLTIDDNAFDGCSSLSSISIPSNVTTIGNDVFTGCTSLADVTIEDREDVLTLGYKASDSSPLFADCSLKNVYIGGDLTYDSSSTAGYSPFYGNTSLETLTITDEETEITDYEFYGCSGLKTAEIGEGVTTIGANAFSGCSSLESFSFGSSVTTIGETAFAGCTAMTSLTSLATTPPTCGTNALYDINKWYCTLYIPAGTKSLYQEADQWMDFLLVVGTFEADGITYTITSSEDLTVEVSSSLSGEYSGDIVIPATLEYEGVTYTVTSIDESAFADCADLTSVTIPSTVTTIGDNAFSGCTGLTSITSEATTPPTCGTDVFNGVDTESCTLYVPESSIETYQATDQWKEFSVITGIVVETIVVDGITYTITSSDGLTVEITASSDTEYTGDIVIPETIEIDGVTYTVTSIAASAFADCAGITSIVIPSTVTSIGDYAFSGCTGLTSITCLATTPPTCGTGVFEGVDTDNCTLYVPEDSIELYENADPWKDFLNIKEETYTGISAFGSDAAGLQEVSRYNMNGQRIDGAQRGVNIIRYSDGSIKKVYVK